MHLFLQQLLNRLQNFLSQTTTFRRIFLVSLSVVIIGIFFLIIYWINQPNYKVLYSRLLPENTTKIIARLKADKQPYIIEDNGATILVPEDKVYDLRLKIAGEVMLISQSIGFEIFDDSNKVSQTDFVQQINYQRALQGEITRTILEFSEIERARVHIIIPKKSLDIEKQTIPSASIVLKFKEGKRMEQSQVQSIVNLVTLAVEGLNKSRIIITDTSGKRIYCHADDNIEGQAAAHMQYKLTLQQNMEQRIEEMLKPLVSTGRVITKVNVDIDFSQKTIRKELFDPEKTVIRNEQRNEEIAQRKINAESGSMPNTNNYSNDITNTINQQPSRESRLTHFEINKEEQQIVNYIGELRRISVAVIIDGTYEKGSGGEWIFNPCKNEDLVHFKQLIQNAVGYEPNRGDTVEVTSISFGSPENPKLELEPNLINVITDYSMHLGKPLLSTLLLILFLILVMRPMILALIQLYIEKKPLDELKKILPKDKETLLPPIDANDKEKIVTSNNTKKIEDIKAHAMQLSENNMEQAAAIIKLWLK